MSAEDTARQTEENTTAIKLIQKDLGYMRQGIDEIKEQISSLMKSISEQFVKKEEYSSLEDRVSNLENLKDWAIKIVIGSVILTLLTLVGLRS